MAQYTAPYVNFQGRAREAFDFYHGILGGRLTLIAFDEDGKMKKAGASDPIGYGRLEADGVRIIGSDGNPAHPASPGDTIAVLLSLSDRATLGRVFDSLAEGGTVTMPLTDAPWGTAGWLKDRFGITWNADKTS